MKVRDRTKSSSEYKGRSTYAIDKYCPCRSCWNSHDCGKFEGGRWHANMACATNYNTGCPNPLPEPQHIWKGKTCVRCGARLKIDK